MTGQPADPPLYEDARCIVSGLPPTSCQECLQCEVTYLASSEPVSAEDLRAALELVQAAWNDDAAIAAGVAAVRKQLMFRVGDQHDHAKAFRLAALASARGETGT